MVRQLPIFWGNLRYRVEGLCLKSEGALIYTRSDNGSSSVCTRDDERGSLQLRLTFDESREVVSARYLVPNQPERVMRTRVYKFTCHGDDVCLASEKEGHAKPAIYSLSEAAEEMLVDLLSP
jgi:hypothetical protein